MVKHVYFDLVTQFPGGLFVRQGLSPFFLRHSSNATSAAGRRRSVRRALEAAVLRQQPRPRDRAVLPLPRAASSAGHAAAVAGARCPCN